MISNKFIMIVLVIFCGLLTGCASTQISRVSILQAPEVQKATKFQSIAILPISGTYGDEVTSAIEAAFINAKIQGKPAYKDVLRVNSARSLRNMMPFAKPKGMEAMLLGEVVAANVNDSRSTKTEYVCTQTKKVKKILEKCVAGYERTVFCTNRKAVMQVKLKLVDSLTSSPVYNEVISHFNDVTACGNEQVVSGRELMNDLVHRVVNTVQVKLIPHDRLLEIRLMSADNKIEQEQKFNNALKFATQDRMDRACDMFRELYDSAKDSPALNYNLGVCEEIVNAYWRANEYFEIADRLTTTPNELINTALVRTKNNLSNLAALANNRKDLNLKRQIEAGAAPQTINKTKIDTSVSTTPVISSPVPKIDSESLMMDRRVALVIGNAKYKAGALINPVNDARAITKELRSANFQVISVENADLEKMKLAIDEFSKAIKKDGVALVFYAGHGMQVKGENYLIPIDAAFKTESDVSYQSINLGYILSRLESAKSRVNIVILDACRDNPFARSWRSGKGGGLASIDAPAGTLIAFATAPGKTAADGSGVNGLYTSHLLHQLRIQNQKIEDILKNTRKAVAAASGQEQIPWDSSSMTGDFYFRVSNKSTN